jgi:hypothetical protein
MEGMSWMIVDRIPKIRRTRIKRMKMLAAEIVMGITTTHEKKTDAPNEMDNNPLVSTIAAEALVTPQMTKMNFIASQID